MASLKESGTRRRVALAYAVRSVENQAAVQNRVFFPQTAFDQWLVDGSVELSGNELTILAEKRKYRIAEAVRVLREVTGQPDQNDIVGKVKSKIFFEELGAELLEGSMIIGDNAYDVIQGWLGAPTSPFDQHAAARASQEFGDEPKTDEDVLARFLLKSL